MDPSDDHLIVFDVDWLEHSPLPDFVAFQIPVKIRNSNISCCIINEGASTCVMSTSVWKQLGSPELAPSTITLRAWDGHASQPIGLFRNFPITLAGKTVCVDVEVIDAPLDYNIILGRSYTYAMSAVPSTVFCKMSFPQDRKSVV